MLKVKPPWLGQVRLLGAGLAHPDPMESLVLDAKEAL